MFKKNQKTTKAGVALIGGAVAMAAGNADVISISVTPSGIEVSGLAEMLFSLITGAVGVVLGIFDEDKRKND
ncbi:TPA: hypothetical protein JG819_004694 [Vibrio parahaemolyticus]|nr:hypothetical protein [Vibrio parahaemolyticus]HAV1545594.1 hypothetical protein [Vibrio parahaemolyticus]